MDIGPRVAAADLPQQTPEQRLTSDVDQAFREARVRVAHALAHAGGENQVAHFRGTGL
jgi:hypothetical protein